VGELGATTGDIEFGNAEDEAGVASWASSAGGAAADADAGGSIAGGRTAGGRAAGGTAAAIGLVESADAILTGSATGVDGAGAAATVVGGNAAAAGAAAVTGPAESADAILIGSAAGAEGGNAAATGAIEAPVVTGAAGAEAALAVAALPETVAAASTGPLPVSAGLEAADATVEPTGAGSLAAGGLDAAANGPLVPSPGFTSTA
jgi:hypothetical protein